MSQSKRDRLSKQVQSRIEHKRIGMLENLGEVETDQPRTSNTGHPSSLLPPFPEENPPVTPEIQAHACSRGGVDFLELSFYGCWERQAGEKLFADLENGQTQSQENEAGFFASLNEDNPLVGVLPSGIGSAIRCRWAVVWRGIKIGFVARMASEKGRPIMRVSIPSNPLMLHGHHQLWDDLLDFLKGLGWHHERATVSRVDVCADLVEMGVESFVKRFNAGKVIRRSRYQRMEGMGQYETLTLGKGILCRIYDKRSEALRSDEKLSIMKARRWGGHLPDKATRVEFQLRGEDLKERLPDNEVETVFEHLAELAEWCTTDWLRFTKQVVDRENKNQQRATDAPEWQEVKEAFKAWTGEPTKTLLKPQCEDRTDVKKLALQMAGCAAAAIARTYEGAVNEVVWIREWNAIGMKIAKRGMEKVDQCRQMLTFTSALGPPVDLAGVPF